MKPRILIAEDNPDTRALLAKVMDRDGSYRVHFAKTGQEALDLFGAGKLMQDPFAVLILDNAMPNKTGVTVAEEIRAAGDDSIPIMFFTALRPDEIEADAKRLHACVIYKPEAVSEINGHIEKALAGEMGYGRCA